MKTHVKKDLDKGWHMLIQEARSIGLGIHDVRQFLESETASRKKTTKKPSGKTSPNRRIYLPLAFLSPDLSFHHILYSKANRCAELEDKRCVS